MQRGCWSADLRGPRTNTYAGCSLTASRHDSLATLLSDHVAATLGHNGGQDAISCPPGRGTYWLATQEAASTGTGLFSQLSSGLGVGDTISDTLPT
jgi:hypothetical protein